MIPNSGMRMYFLTSQNSGLFLEVETGLLRQVVQAADQQGYRDSFHQMMGEMFAHCTPLRYSARPLGMIFAFAPYSLKMIIISSNIFIRSLGGLMLIWRAFGNKPARLLGGARSLLSCSKWATARLTCSAMKRCMSVRVSSSFLHARKGSRRSQSFTYSG